MTCLKRGLITELHDNIYCIKVRLPGTVLGNINSYLIKGSDRNLLIDTGYRVSACINALKGGLDYLGVDMKKTDICLTHFHNDHSGASTDLIDPGRSIFVPKDDFKFFRIGKDPDFYNKSRRDKYTMEGLDDEDFDKMMRTRGISAVCPDFFSNQYKSVNERDIIHVGKYNLEACHTPGHTPGHMCYYDKEHKILFSGDHVLFDISPNSLK